MTRQILYQTKQVRFTDLKGLISIGLGSILVYSCDSLGTPMLGSSQLAEQATAESFSEDRVRYIQSRTKANHTWLVDIVLKRCQMKVLLPCPGISAHAWSASTTRCRCMPHRARSGTTTNSITRWVFSHTTWSFCGYERATWEHSGRML